MRVTSLKGPGAGEYYVVEPGGYYLAAREPPGRWFGQAADRLGLGVSFDDGQFVAVLAGIDPSTGAPLGRVADERSVRGYDVTFAAPKSVSLLAALSDSTVRARFTLRMTRRSTRSSATCNAMRSPVTASMVR